MDATMLKCYLVHEYSIWGNPVPKMVCASEAEAKVIAESFGLNEVGKPRGQVIELPYQPNRGA